ARHARNRHGLHRGRPLVAGSARHGRLRRRAVDVPRRLALATLVVVVASSRRNVSHRDLRAARHQADLLGAPVAAFRSPGGRAGAGVGRAGDPGRSDRPVRSRPGPGPRPGRHRHRPPAGPDRGAMIAFALDLVLLFVAFELMSIPLYVLAGFAKREAGAAEAALKFFLVGSVSSAVMAYGLSFVYGAARSTSLAAAAKAVPDADGLLILGLLAVFGGFGFKIAAFPFHMWVPDTYEAAPTPFVAWLSVTPKAAGFVALFRVYFE